MLLKILEKYSKLSADHEAKQNKQNQTINEYDAEIIKNFLQLYDKDVKKIHANEEIIEKNLLDLHNESKKFLDISNQAMSMYNELVEYFKEAGDLYNWCTILEKQMDDVRDKILNTNTKKSNQKDEIDNKKDTNFNIQEEKLDK